MIPSVPVPEIFGLPVATVALIVAGAGFAVSLIALCWQIAKHLLDGGRVRVYLNAASWEPDFLLRTNRTGKWAMRSSGTHMMPENIEVAQLVVENPGRTAITIYSPGLAIEGAGSKRHTISPRMFKADKMGPDTAVRETVVRIDPYDRVTFLLDYWSIIPRLLETAVPKGIELRGYVSVAGRKRPQKSSWSLRWRIPQGAWTSYKDEPEISPRTVMWRELYRAAGAEDETATDRRLSKSMLGWVLFDAMEKFEERPGREDLAAALDEVAKSYGRYDMFGIATLNMYAALDNHEGHLGRWRWRPATATPSDEDQAEQVEHEIEIEQ